MKILIMEQAKTTKVSYLANVLKQYCDCMYKELNHNSVTEDVTFINTQKFDFVLIFQGTGNTIKYWKSNASFPLVKALTATGFIGLPTTEQIVKQTKCKTFIISNEKLEYGEMFDIIEKYLICDTVVSVVIPDQNIVNDVVQTLQTKYNIPNNDIQVFNSEV